MHVRELDSLTFMLQCNFCMANFYWKQKRSHYLQVACANVYVIEFQGLFQKYWKDITNQGVQPLILLQKGLV